MEAVVSRLTWCTARSICRHWLPCPSTQPQPRHHRPKPTPRRIRVLTIHHNRTRSDKRSIARRRKHRYKAGPTMCHHSSRSRCRRSRQLLTCKEHGCLIWALNLRRRLAEGLIRTSSQVVAVYLLSRARGSQPRGFVSGDSPAVIAGGLGYGNGDMGVTNSC